MKRILTLFFLFAVCLQPWAATAEVVMHRGNGAEPDSLDPHLTSGTWESNVVGDLFLGLTTEDVKGQTIPGAAESWTTSADGLTWTFKLRPGLVWSDGAPLKASDFVYAFRRLLDPKTAARYAFVQYGIKNAEAINSGKMPPEALGVRAIDDLTFEMITETPLPYLPGLLTHSTSYPLPEHVVSKHGREWIKPGTVVSNGAYTLVEWNPHDKIKIVKNPTFYDAANVRIDTVFFYPIEDEQVILTRYRAREIDVNIASRSFPANELPWLRENMPNEVHVVPALATDYLVANIRRKPWNDVRLRQALALALDRELVTQKINRDGRVPAYSFVPPGISNYTTPPRLEYADWPKEKRQAEAKRLLVEAGYGPNNPLTFTYNFTSGRDFRKQVAAEMALWKEVGLIAKPVMTEPKVHYNTVQQGDFEVSWAAWSADFDDPQTFLAMADSRSGIFNYGGYSNPVYDALLDKAKTMLDLQQRALVMREAEEVMLRDFAIIPTSFRSQKLLVATYVKGFEENATATHRSRWMSIDGKP